MLRCSAETVRWKGRRAFRLSSGEIEVTVLLGGGHIADLRRCGHSINALWEAPWPTIEPYEFSPLAHSAAYGERVTGQMLSGYTGHALALGYYGMPESDDARRGLSLHGEAASSEWRVADTRVAPSTASVTLETSVPLSQWYVRRTLRVASEASTVTVTESVRNTSAVARHFQWVEHAAFGEPLFAGDESTLALSGDRAVTWPLGYEGHELLPNDFEFRWPRAGDHDLSAPFLEDGTGFVAAVQVDPGRTHGFVAVHNRRRGLASGYVFNARRFPWIVLWEENRARAYPPWNGRTRVRGVEFGTSPMPLGLEQAQRTRSLWGTPVLATIAAGAELAASYQMFVTPVPLAWRTISDVRPSGDRLLLQSASGEELLL